MLTLSVLVPSVALADWQMTDKNVNKLFNTDTNGNQFALVQNRQEIDFTLSLVKLLPASKQTISKLTAETAPDRVYLTIDSAKVMSTDLQYISQSDGRMQLVVVLDAVQKKELIKRMIAGLEIRILVKHKNKSLATATYSLVGFTAEMNDFLIAMDIGKLNYQWLAGQAMHKELVCLYAATVYVQALLDRQSSLTIENSMEKLPKTGMLQLEEEVGPELIRTVYKLPAYKIPIEPRGDKYAIFHSCMSK